MIVRLFMAAGFLVALAACQSTVSPPPDRVLIGDGVHLDLPLPPKYSHRQSLVQMVDGRYEDRRQVFQSVVLLSPDLVRMIITLPSGPRMLTIDWSAAGIEVDRSALVPDDLHATNILADLMILLWDLESINKALAGTATVRDAENRRTVSHGDRTVITVDRQAAPGRIEFTNHDFGYRLTIRTTVANAA